MVYELIAMAAITALAYWQRQFIIYLIAGIVIIIVALIFARAVNMAIGVMIGCLGAYTLWKAIEAKL